MPKKKRPEQLDTKGFEVGDAVKIHSLYFPIDGKEGKISRMNPPQCDVKVDGNVHLLFLDQLTKLP